MQTLCAFVVAALTFATPILFLIWLIRKIARKPAKKFGASALACSICFVVFVLLGAFTDPATYCDHEYVEVERKDATCEESGFTKYQCKLCGRSKTEKEKKLGHEMVDYRRVDPTYDSDGECVRRCQRCGYEEVEVLKRLKRQKEETRASSETGAENLRAEFMDLGFTESESKSAIDIFAQCGIEIQGEIVKIDLGDAVNAPEFAEMETFTSDLGNGLTLRFSTNQKQVFSVEVCQWNFIDGDVSDLLYWDGEGVKKTISDVHIPETEVSSSAELTLQMIFEDMAKQIAQNPGTVHVKFMTQTFARKDRVYGVQGEFTCSNLLGVSEEHTLTVVCETNEDQSKIQPYKIILDNVVVEEFDRRWPDE